MFKKALIASAMLVSAIGANAAPTATMGATGTATPGACDITLGGTGKADYGTLTSSQVRALAVWAVASPVYILPQKLVSISVTCSAATKAQLAFTDVNPGKNVAVDVNDPYRYGLVDGAGTVAIGSYQSYLTTKLVDGIAPAGVLHAPNGTTTWLATGFNNMPLGTMTPGTASGFIKTVGNAVPDSFTTFTANITTDLWVNKSYLDNAVNAVVFNGGTVITMQYL